LQPKPRIAVFSGPSATVQNSAPLVTSNKARAKYGLPLRTRADGTAMRWDALRAQRLAAPVTVFVEQFSAHPLEHQVAELYAPPDGYIGRDGTFRTDRQSPDDVPVYEVTLQADDGLYLLPYMARQANGQPWEEDGTTPGAPINQTRIPFFPDASRMFEEIDRLSLAENGVADTLGGRADYDFYRPAPSGGYTKGLAAALRTDKGEGDIPPEVNGEDFFVYRPSHLGRSPTTGNLARLTNIVQRAMGSGDYDGGIYLEGSPSVEETIYWLNLLIDTTVPIVANSAQRAHGTISADGDRNIVDSVDYIRSRIWAGADGRDEVGAVAILDEVIFTSREVQKGDARPGGYVATGGHGGIVGSIGQPGPPVLTFRPARLHTWRSAVNTSQLPASVMGVKRAGHGVQLIPVQVRNPQGDLIPAAIPYVTIEKTSRWLPLRPSVEKHDEVDILAQVDRNLREAPLAGFVSEGSAPFARMTDTVIAALNYAACCGMPVVRVGRGNAEGFAPPPTKRDLCISGNNLTATKARLLLMACLLRFGAPPPAANPDQPTEDETAAIQTKLHEYQAVFDTH
jgi:L-asparaginase